MVIEEFNRSESAQKIHASRGRCHVREKTWYCMFFHAREKTHGIAHGIALTNTCKSACTQYKWNSKLQLDRTLKSDEQAKPPLVHSKIHNPMAYDLKIYNLTST